MCPDFVALRELETWHWGLQNKPITMRNQNIRKKNTYNLSGLRNQHPQSTTKDLNVPDVPSLIQETLTQLESQMF